MRLKKYVAACAVLLFFTNAANASFLSGFIRSVAVAFAEQREIENAPDCALSADDALARSIELLSDGRQAEAEDLIKSAVKSHRDDVRILFAKAVLERSHWNKDAADVWFAMTRKAKGNEALSRAAWLSIQLDQKKSVEENMAELIRLSDENPDNIYLLWLGAIQCREQSRLSSPLARSQKTRMAELGAERYEILLECFDLGPIMVHHTYANILTEDLNRSNEALEHRFIAVSMAARPWTLEGLADTLTHLKKYRQACVTWRQATRMNGRNARYYNRWGDALFGLKCYVEAEEKYREAIRLLPRKGYYWDDLADCLEKQGNREEEMFEAYQRAVELGYDWALGSLGWCYEFGHGVEKNPQKAFELYWLYAEKTDSAYARYKLGDCYSMGIGVQKDLHKAREYYEEAVKVDPSHSDALNALAWNLTSSKDPALLDYPRAIELVKRSIELDENKYNLDTLAVAYFKNEQYDEAVKAQERIIEYWQSENPGKPIPKGKLKRLEKYKKFQKQTKEAP